MSKDRISKRILLALFSAGHRDRCFDRNGYAIQIHFVAKPCR
jgi:hypothetical protein